MLILLHSEYNCLTDNKRIKSLSQKIQKQIKNETIYNIETSGTDRALPYAARCGRVPKTMGKSDRLSTDEDNGKSLSNVFVKDGQECKTQFLRK